MDWTKLYQDTKQMWIENGQNTFEGRLLSSLLKN